jgi:AraC-like DNA-binding protein
MAVAAMTAPRTAFKSTEQKSPGAAFRRWQERCSSLFEVNVADRFGSDSFSVDVASYHLGSVVLSQTSATGQRYARTPGLIARSGVDHMIVQLMLRGAGRGVTGAKTDYMLRAGEVSVLDLSQTMRTETTDYAQVALFVPRPVLAQLLGDVGALHGTVLQQADPRTRIFADHLRSLALNGPRLPVAEFKSIGEATLGLFAACMRPNGRPGPQVQSALAAIRIRRLKDHIDSALTDPDFGVEAIVRQAGLSRRSLYRLFEPQGGVAEFIRNRRLRLAARAIADARNAGQRIIDIAFDHGFTNEAAFSRAFRRRFGLSPREMRHRVPVQSARGIVSAASSDWVEFDRWVRSLDH